MILLPGDLLLLLLPVLALLLLLVWWLVRGRAEKVATSVPGVFPVHVQLTPQAVMSHTDAVLYNVLRLVVQDQYLLFAQVPLWVAIRTQDPRDRRAYLRQVAFRKLDFVLVHPGTLLAEKVIQIRSPANDPQEQRQQETIRAAVQLAGVELVEVPADCTYTVAGLAAVLGLAPDDDGPTDG